MRPISGCGDSFDLSTLLKLCERILVIFQDERPPYVVPVEDFKHR
jgi:hypothetical protein